MRYLAIFLWKIIQTIIWGIQCILVVVYTILVVVWMLDLNYFYFKKESFWFFVDNCNSNLVVRKACSWEVFPSLEFYKQYYKTPKNLWLGHKTLEFRGKTLTFKNH